MTPGRCIFPPPVLRPAASDAGLLGRRQAGVRPEGGEGKPRLETLDRGRPAPLGEKHGPHPNTFTLQPPPDLDEIISRLWAVGAQITDPYLNPTANHGRLENVTLHHVGVSKGSSYLMQELTVLDKVCHQVFKKA